MQLVTHQTGPEGRQVKKVLVEAAANVETDCSLAEINPLMITGSGDVVALDAKMTFDDNALFRHLDIKEFRDLDEEDPLEVEADLHGDEAAQPGVPRLVDDTHAALAELLHELVVRQPVHDGSRSILVRGGEPIDAGPSYSNLSMSISSVVKRSSCVKRTALSSGATAIPKVLGFPSVARSSSFPSESRRLRSWCFPPSTVT